MASIFHIGYHKTGTTFLQRHFFPRSVNYAYIGGDLARDITDPFVGDFDPLALRRTCEKTFGENFICSSESLAGDPLYGGFNGLAIQNSATRISAAFPEARVLLFVREQTDVIQSLYAQYVKYGGTFSLPRVINAEREISPFFNLEYYEYDKILRILRSEFDADRILVYDHRCLSESPQKLLERMNQDLGLGIQDFSGLTTRSNIKMKRNTCRMLRRLNLLTSRYTKCKTYWMDIPHAERVIGRIRVGLDRWMPFNPPIAKGDFWRKGQREALIDYYCSSNARLRDMCGIDLQASA